MVRNAVSADLLKNMCKESRFQVLSLMAHSKKCICVQVCVCARTNFHEAILNLTPLKMYCDNFSVLYYFIY